MLEKLKGIVHGTKTKPEEDFHSGVRLKDPKHIAITIDGTLTYSKVFDISADASFLKFGLALRKVMDYQLDRKIPIMTIYLLRKQESGNQAYDEFISRLAGLLNNLVHHESISKGYTKVSIIGKWYDLPGDIVDSVRKLIDVTKENEEYYLNFCLNYDGQEEIVDACRLLVRQAVAGRMDISQITAEKIKENTYSSYFIPPDIIIKNAHRRYTKGLLLFDSSFSILHFTDRPFPDIKDSDIDDAITLWRKG